MARPDPEFPLDPPHDPREASGARGPLIHVATRCTSIDEFIEKFASFASEGALVLPASGELPIGTEGRFAILLRDRSVAMRGRCRVTDAKPAPAGASGAGVRRTMLRVALLDMDDATRAVHQRLIASQRPPVPIMVAQAFSERTEVSLPRPEVTAPRPEVTAPRPERSTPRQGVTAPRPDLSAPRPDLSARRPEPSPRAVVAPPVTVRPVVPPPVAGLAATPPTAAPRAAPVAPPAVSFRPVEAHVPPLRTVTPSDTAARGDTARGPAPAIPTFAPPGAGKSPVAPPAAARPAPAASSYTRAPTLIGVPSARSTDGTMTRGSQDATITAVAVPPHETRAPGAAFTLPANPLSELGPEDLASFIDCTLFESVDEVEAVVTDDAGPTAEIDPLAPARPFVIPGSPGAEGWLAPAPPPTAAKKPASKPGAQARVVALAKSYGLYAAFAVGGLVLGLALLAILRPARMRPPAAPPALAPAARAPEIVETPPAELAPAPKPAEVVAAPKPAGAVRAPKPAEPVAAPKPAEAVRAPKPAEAVAPPKPAETVRAPKPAEAVAPPKPAEAVRAPKPAEAVPALEAAEAASAPKPAAVAPKPAAGGAGDGCLVRVVSEPTEAQVLWGSKLIGVTPLEGARVPCGAASVTLRRERWQPVTRDVTATANETTVVSQKLHRPAATLIVGSSPPHAEITVNGLGQGFTPKRISVSRFESVSIQVALAGYAPWKKTVYVRQPETHIGMQLGHADAGKRSGGR